MRTTLYVALLLTGCTEAASIDVDDSEAEGAPLSDNGKADGAAFVGIFAQHTTHHYNGDIPSIELRSDGQYVRERCYHASCALAVPEVDAFDTYTSSSGKTYVRFHSWKSSHDADGNLVQTPAIADVYEIATFSKGIKLRKSYSTRWQTLYLSSPSLQCLNSGGTFDGNDCACPGNAPNAFPAFTFVPGAGGCMASVHPDESACDDSGGAWWDDDANLAGAYCTCGLGRYVNDTGACTAI